MEDAQRSGAVRRLAQLVRELAQTTDPALLLGVALFDDAAAYRLSDDVAIVSTAYVFPPLWITGRLRCDCRRQRLQSCIRHGRQGNDGAQHLRHSLSTCLPRLAAALYMKFLV